MIFGTFISGYADSRYVCGVKFRVSGQDAFEERKINENEWNPK